MVVHVHRTALLFGSSTVVALSLGLFALVGSTVYHRVTFPFELSQFESCFVDSARQIASGNSIYIEPTAHWTPLIYTPISYYCGAGLIAAGVEHGFLATRLVSVLGVCAATLLGVWLTARASSRKWLCLLVPPLVAAQYFHADAHFDQARPDNLLALFLVGSVLATTIRSNLKATSLFTVCAVLAIFTKQSIVVFYIAFFPVMLILRRRPAMYSAASVLLIGLTMAGLIDLASSGWFIEHTIRTPSFHGVSYKSLIQMVSHELLGDYAIVTTAIVLTATYALLSPHVGWPADDAKDRTFLTLLGAACAILCYSMVARWNLGSVVYVHVLYAILGAAFIPAAMDWTIEKLAATDTKNTALNVMMVGIVLILLSGFDRPKRFTPCKADADQWMTFRKRLAHYGPTERLWVPLHSAALGDTLNDPRWSNAAALRDYVGGYFGSDTGRSLPKTLKNKIAAQYFSAIAIGDGERDIEAWIKPYYQPDPAWKNLELPQFSGFPMIRKTVVWIPQPAEKRGDPLSSTPGTERSP